MCLRLGRCATRRFMTRDRKSAAWWLAFGFPCLCVLFSCRLDDTHYDAALLSPDEATPAPLIRRWTFEPPVDHHGVRAFPMGVVPPFYGLVYDPRMERFVFPGQLGLGEDGSVDGDPDALGFPLEGAPVSMRDVYIGIGYCDRDYIDRSECDERETFEPIDVTRVVFAVYQDSRSVRVLHAEKVFGRNARYATPRLFLSSFDPANREQVLSEELWLPNPRELSHELERDPRWVERTLRRFC